MCNILGTCHRWENSEISRKVFCRFEIARSLLLDPDPDSTENNFPAEETMEYELL
jgi:hypothetical protein